MDQTGRGQGVCELVELPLARMDIGHDLYPDKDYDFYERDRNSIPPDCRPPGMSSGPGSYGPSYSPDPFPKPGHNPWDDRYRPPATAVGRPMYGMDDREYPPRPRPYLPDRRPSYTPPSYDSFPPSRDHYNSRPDFQYGQSDRNFYADRYRPRPPPPAPPINDRWYLPEYNDKRYYYDRERDRNYWGFDSEREHMYKHWASYGGSYGNFGRPDSVYSDRKYLPQRPPTRWPASGSGYDDRKQSNFIPYQIAGDSGIVRYNKPPNRGSYGSYGYNMDQDTSKYWGLDPPKYGGGGYLPMNGYGSSGMIHYGGVGTGGYERWNLEGGYPRPVRPLDEVGYGRPVRPITEMSRPLPPLPPPRPIPPIDDGYGGGRPLPPLPPPRPIRPIDDGYGSGRPSRPLDDSFRPSYGPSYNSPYGKYHNNLISLKAHERH